MNRYTKRLQKELQTLQDKYGDDIGIDDESNIIQVIIIEKIDEKDIHIMFFIDKERFPFEKFKIMCTGYSIIHKTWSSVKRIIDIIDDLVSKFKIMNNFNRLDYDDENWNIYKKFDLLVLCATEETKINEKWKQFLNSKYIDHVSFSGTMLNKPINNNKITGHYDIIFAEFCDIWPFKYFKDFPKDEWGKYTKYMDLVVQRNLKYEGFLVIPKIHYDRLMEMPLNYIKILKKNFGFWGQIRSKYFSHNKEIFAYQKKKTCLVCGKEANLIEESGTNIFCSKECQIKYYNE